MSHQSIHPHAKLAAHVAAKALEGAKSVGISATFAHRIPRVGPALSLLVRAAGAVRGAVEGYNTYKHDSDDYAVR